MRKTTRLFILLAAAGFSAAASAQAQPIYRCGTSYSQKPCPGGGGKTVEVDDARSASQRSDTMQATQRDAKAADALEKARLKEEAKPAQVLLPPPKAPEAATSTPKPGAKSKTKKPDQFTAVAPKNSDDAEKKKKKKSAKSDV